MPLVSFLASAQLDRWAHAQRPERPPVGSSEPHRRTLLYPVRAGQGEALVRMLGAGTAPGTPAGLSAALVSSTIFGRGDVVVRFWEANAILVDEIANIARVVPYSGLGAALNDLLDTAEDLTTEDGFRTFFTRSLMSPVAGRPSPDRWPADAAQPRRTAPETA
jgi:hypothetical protein